MNRQSVLVFGALLLLLAGCGGGDPSDSNESVDRDSDADKPRVDSHEDVPPRDDGAVVDGVEVLPAEPDPREGWATYRHALGASLKHPAGWTTQETPMGVALVPSDHHVNEEALVLWGMQVPAGQGDDLLSAESVGHMDALVGQLMPGLTRAGRPKQITTKHGPGAVYTYQGNAPDGQAVAAHVYFTSADGVGLGLTVFGLAEHVTQRSGMAELVFTSIGMDEPETGDGQAAAQGTADNDDPRLVGVFRGEALAGGGAGQAYINTQLLYVLNSDGTFLSGAQSHMHMSDRDYNGNLKWTAYNTSDGSVVTGTWSARNGVLTITWDKGGRSVFAYGFEPDGTLAMRDAVTRKLINIYTRVR